jgi:hypothetical protein
MFIDMVRDCVRWHDLVFTSPNLWYNFKISIIMRTNITSSTGVHFRRLSRSGIHKTVGKWLYSTVNSNQ